MAKHYIREVNGPGRVGASLTLYRHPDGSVTLAASGPADAIGIGVNHDENGRFVEIENANAPISESELTTACASIIVA